MAESFRSSLDPGISERTNAPLSFFLFFIFIFLPSSRVDLFKGPRLIDPRDPRGDLFGRLWYKQSDTWWSMQSSCRDETSRNAKVQELSAFTGVPDSDNTPRRECLAWKNRYFSTYRERCEFAKGDPMFLSYYSILYGVDGFVRRYNLSALKIIIYPSFNNNYKGDQWWFSLRWSSYRILTNDIDSV